MTWLEIIIIVTWVVFIIFSFDLYQRKKFTLLHFLVFAWGSLSILLFTRFPWALDTFGWLFGLARWADLIVYLSIIFLWHGYIQLINSFTKHATNLTSVISKQAIKVVKHQMRASHWSIWFLIRAYNEEKSIEKVIESIITAWYTFIVICDDGSTDLTWTLVKQSISKYSNSDISIILLEHSLNRGPGSANKTLFWCIKEYKALLTLDRRVTYDADGQMDIGDMKSFEVHMNNDVDVLLWSRTIQWGSMHGVPFLRKQILRLSRVFTYIFTGRYFSDPHNGYRMIRTEILEHVAIHSDTMTYASELLEEFIRLDARITEIPVSITYTEETLSKGQKNTNSLKIVSELMYRWWFYK